LFKNQRLPAEVALTSKEPIKIVEKLNINSRCNTIYQKLISTLADIALQTVKKIRK